MEWIILILLIIFCPMVLVWGFVAYTVLVVFLISIIGISKLLKK